jgi:hypothetical protein
MAPAYSNYEHSTQRQAVPALGLADLYGHGIAQNDGYAAAGLVGVICLELGEH